MLIRWGPLQSESPRRRSKILITYFWEHGQSFILYWHKVYRWAAQEEVPGRFPRMLVPVQCCDKKGVSMHVYLVLKSILLGVSTGNQFSLS